MSIPRFKIAVNTFGAAEEEKLLGYLKDIVGSSTTTVSIIFQFSADAEYKITALTNEAKDQGFLLTLSQRYDVDFYALEPQEG